MSTKDEYEYHFNLDEPPEVKTERFKELDTLNPLGRIFSDTMKDIPDHSSLCFKQKLTTAWINHMAESTDKTLPSKKRKTGDSDQELLPTFTEKQSILLGLFGSFHDIMYADRAVTDSDEIMSITILHVLNHIFKTRDRILSHNSALAEWSTKRKDLIAELKIMKKKKESTLDIQRQLDQEVEFRDQGFTRPKALVLLPMRNACYTFVELLMKLVPKVYTNNISNKKKFADEFYAETEPPKGFKPEDWIETFQGNSDDNFRLGINFAQKYLNLYTDFYSSDIIIASPLGLRLAIEDQQEGNADFLSSIEIVVVDLADIILMQNWDHVEFIFERLSKIPSKPRETDFSRVRPWYVNGKAKMFRQTILLSSLMVPEYNALFNNHCNNYKGTVKIRKNIYDGIVDTVSSNIQKIFYKIECESVQNLDEDRYQHFLFTSYFNLRNSMEKRTILFVPSYYDFVRIKKLLKQKSREDDLEIGFCSEYTPSRSVNRNRSYFRDGSLDIVVITERFYFYNRCFFKGVHNVLFYAPPLRTDFYKEMCDMISTNGTCALYYTRYDTMQIEFILGRKRCEEAITSDDSVYSIV